MNAGLPGIGLSGVFFIVSALLMPVAEVGRTLRGRRTGRSWRSILAHWFVAVGMIAAMWGAGRLLTFALDAVGYEVADGIWTSAAFSLVLFMLVFTAVELVALRRLSRDRGD